MSLSMQCFFLLVHSRDQVDHLPCEVNGKAVGIEMFAENLRVGGSIFILHIFRHKTTK